MQGVEALSNFSPFEQNSQSVVLSLFPSAYFPEGQSLQLLSPSTSAYIPTLQSLHVVCPAWSWYVPFSQDSHSSPSSASFSPTPHAPCPCPCPHPPIPPGQEDVTEHSLLDDVQNSPVLSVQAKALMPQRHGPAFTFFPIMFEQSGAAMQMQSVKSFPHLYTLIEDGSMFAEFHFIMWIVDVEEG